VRSSRAPGGHARPTLSRWRALADGSYRPGRHHLGRMREAITVEVSAAGRARLEGIVADRNS
jgi:hypothetical protein